MKRALVTGADGFIGRHLVEALRWKGVEVRGLVRPGRPIPARAEGLAFVVGEIGDGAAMALAAEGCDSVFHLAGRAHALAETKQDEALYHATNAVGTASVFGAAESAGARRFVLFSSVKAMGEETPATAPLDESASCNPRTAYGRSKLAAEQLVLERSSASALGAVCLRLPLVYGVGQKGNLFRMIEAIDRHRFPPLPEAGNRRSLVHVEDAAAAALLASVSPAAVGERFIVAEERPYSTWELYEQIVTALGRRVPRWSIPLGALRAFARLGDATGRMRRRRFVFDSDALEKLTGSAWYSGAKIRERIGFLPRRSLPESLPELVASVRSAHP